MRFRAAKLSKLAGYETYRTRADTRCVRRLQILICNLQATL